MSMYPETVGELRRLLETYPDDLPVMVQGDTYENPDATPNRFVVEFWGPPDTDDPFLLLAGVPFHQLTELKSIHDPNASWNLPK